MTTKTTIPGGWLDQEEVSDIRAVLRSRASQLQTRARRARDLAVTFKATGYEAARESQLGDAARFDERAARIERALAVFEGIEHGARVDALPSPEEEAEQERAFHAAADSLPDARVFAALGDDALRREVSDAIGREITLAEAQHVRTAALALLGEARAPDAAAD